MVLRNLILLLTLMASAASGMEVWFTGRDDVLRDQIVFPVGGVGEVHAWVSGECTDLKMDYGLFSGPAMIIGVDMLVPDAYTPSWQWDYAVFGARNITTGPAVHFATIRFDPGLYGLTYTYSMPMESEPGGVVLLPEPDLFTWQMPGDMNADGLVNGMDVRPFIDAVITGEHATEPSTEILVLIGAMTWLLRSRSQRPTKPNS